MKIYCSGIGGIGLSAYAALQRACGHEVSGSDRALTPLTEDLESQGISVFDSQDGMHVPEDVDLFVYSEAIPEDAPERVKAKEYGIRQCSYFAALGELSKDYCVVAVCGTHGKSSTTAMAAKVLLDAGKDPTVVVGTKVPQLDPASSTSGELRGAGGRNWRKGSSDLFLLEACEYRGSFLNLHPNIILMSNVDGDHFDAFASLEDYQNAYREFLSRLPDDGVLITHMGDADCAKIASAHEGDLIDADTLPLPELSVPGRHMQENAQLVAALSQHLGIESERSLKEFGGTWRRFEVKGETVEGVTVIDDYAHHPREIRATIQAAKEQFPRRRIVCLFQPHMHDRTLRFYDEFLVAFDEADLVCVTDVYDARADVEKEHVDAKKFAGDIHAESVYGGSLEEAKNSFCCSNLQQNDVLLVMGAGDITKIATELVES